MYGHIQNSNTLGQDGASLHLRCKLSMQCKGKSGGALAQMLPGLLAEGNKTQLFDFAYSDADKDKFPDLGYF